MSRIILVFSGIFTFLVEAYPLYAASALSANAFARCSFAGAFPLFGVQSESHFPADAAAVMAWKIPFPFSSTDTILQCTSR